MRHKVLIAAALAFVNAACADSTASDFEGIVNQNEDTQILPVGTGGMSSTPSQQGWYALTHVAGDALPVNDPDRTDGVQIVSGSMYMGSPSNTASNVFHYCLSDGNRYSAYFWYEPLGAGTTYPEFVLHVFPISESGYLNGNIFTYNRYHPDPQIDPLLYTFDKSIPRAC